jgi:hypothetical protein
MAEMGRPIWAIKFSNEPPNAKTRKLTIQAIKGLLMIAKSAMPDTFYESDSRVKRARKLLKHLESFV